MLPYCPDYSAAAVIRHLKKRVRLCTDLAMLQSVFSSFAVEFLTERLMAAVLFDLNMLAGHTNMQLGLPTSLTFVLHIIKYLLGL